MEVAVGSAEGGRASAAQLVAVARFTAAGEIVQFGDAFAVFATGTSHARVGAVVDVCTTCTGSEGLRNKLNVIRCDCV